MESVNINAEERRIRESLVGNVVFLQQCRVATLKPECSPPGTEPLSGWRGVGASVCVTGGGASVGERGQQVGPCGEGAGDTSAGCCLASRGTEGTWGRVSRHRLVETHISSRSQLRALRNDAPPGPRPPPGAASTPSPKPLFLTLCCEPSRSPDKAPWRNETQTAHVQNEAGAHPRSTGAGPKSSRWTAVEGHEQEEKAILGYNPK